MKYGLSDDLHHYAEELSHPKLHFEKDREIINILIYDATLTYLIDYVNNERAFNSDSDEDDLKEIDNYLERLQDMSVLEQSIGLYTKENSELENFSFGLHCLADIHSTCAIVKEIIFNTIFKPKKHSTVLDIGSGTGILLYAGIISAMRNGCTRIIGIGIEKTKRHIQKSGDFLQEIFPNQTIVMKSCDVRDVRFNGLLKSFRKNLVLWVSETICEHMLSMKIENNIITLENNINVQSIVDNYEIFPGNFDSISHIDDCFQLALQKTLKNIPGFLDTVKSKTVGMFPNITHEYRPHKTEPPLILKTGLKPNKRQFLYEVGEEFSQNPDCKTPQKICVRFPKKKRN